MKPIEPHYFVAALMCLAASASPLRAADNEGRWGLGVHGGLYKLVLSDHSDAWTPGWFLGADLKYGLTPKWSLGAEGNWMETNLADLSDPADREDGAGASFDAIPDGPKQRDYVAGLFGEYHFSEDSKLSPYFSIGSGMFFWKWTDANGNTLSSDDPSLDAPASGLSVPDEDLAGNPYELKDQELYVMGGLGLEYFASDAVSFDLGLKFRYLTGVFSSFTGDKDIVGADPGQLDLPRGVVEGLLGLTFHFGGGCPEASVSASADRAEGSVPMDTEHMSTVTGGCPPYTYLWDFGDGTTSTEQNPRHTYQTEGKYTSSVTVTDAKGNQAVGSFAVTATCPPVSATPSGNPTTGTAPFAVAFRAGASGGCPPLTYAWDFGDGATSAEENPTHEYTTDGTYSATLAVTDSKGSTSQAASVSVAASAALIPTPEKPVILEGVNFETNKAVLLEGSGQILNRVAESLIAHPEVKVEVGGHSDADGSEAYNLKLSQRRANAVRDYLVKMGVPPAQLTAKGYGESQPIAPNTTPEGKAENRRVELKRM
jgi:outer membrane protein OmpA-like peptidoglycan-associated protein/opacity protein-like surface antigen